MSDEGWHPEAPVRHAIMRENVGPDVQSTADAEAYQHRPPERDEQRGCEQGPQPQEVVPDHATDRGMLVMRLVLAPERAVEHKTMHERHHGLGHDEGREGYCQFSEHRWP